MSTKNLRTSTDMCTTGQQRMRARSPRNRPGKAFDSAGMFSHEHMQHLQNPRWHFGRILFTICFHSLSIFDLQIPSGSMICTAGQHCRPTVHGLNTRSSSCSLAVTYHSVWFTAHHPVFQPNSICTYCFPGPHRGGIMQDTVFCSRRENYTL